MSIIKEIREITGLSHAKLAAWLGVSKSLVQFAERGERNLQGDASQKLTRLILTVQQLKVAAKKARPQTPAAYTNAAAFALQHKKKMDDHGHIAEKLQRQLDTLMLRHAKLMTRLALLAQMKAPGTALYRSTKKDKHIVGLLESFSRDDMATGLQKQELLQDRIDTELAYADLHRARWKKFGKMGK